MIGLLNICMINFLFFNIYNMITKEETIAKLKENISWSSIDSDICDAINICIDYENETSDYISTHISMMKIC